MKKILFSLLLSGIGLAGFTGQATAQQPAAQRPAPNLFLLGKVWGLVKYFHPAITSGKIDWDDELIKFLPSYKKLTDPRETADSLLAWINRLGDIKECATCSDSLLKDAKLRPDFSWIENLPTPLRTKINYIIHNRSTNQYYLKFMSGGGVNMILSQNEKAYGKISYPDETYGLLCLFRFWNAIEYWYPYKYGLKQSWDAILKKFIPRMQAEENVDLYNQDVEEMLASIDDSHGWILAPPQEGKITYKYLLPFTVKFVEGQALVTSLLNDSLAGKAGIQTGDILDSLDGRAIHDLVKELSVRCPASNTASRMAKLSYRIPKTRGPQSRLTIIRKGQSMTLNVSNFIPKLFPPIDFDPPYFTYAKDSAFCMLDDSIGYVNMGKFNRKDSTRFKELVARTRGLVIDDRQNEDENYGTGAADIVANILLPPHQDFARFSYAHPAYPGVFTLTAPLDMGLSGNDHYYRHKVAILINTNTMSVGEIISMIFKRSPGARLIGTPTAGADGNVTYLPLPGGAVIQFTGLGVYYPDGGETQRIGLQPDITIPQTIAGFLANRDQQLEKAIEWARP